MATDAQKRVVELMPPFFDALGRGDVEAAMEHIDELVHPQVEFTSAIGSELQGRCYRGPDEVRAWFSELVETFDARYENLAFQLVGDDIVVGRYDFTARGRGSGAEVSGEVGVVWELEDRKIRRSNSYRSHAEALAAAEALRA